ncbi:MAG: HAMP domain-containing histidine kinase [Muribaculaceae bacterium]|nr:HAMP domain-containing histidine kinase [Muribaculaceae bacterium]
MLTRLIYLLMFLMSAGTWCAASTTTAGMKLFTDSQRHMLQDSVRRVLSKKVTANDSVPLLYDLLDLSDTNQRTYRAQDLLNTARNNHSVSVSLDAMRLLANFTTATMSNDKMSDTTEIIRLINEAEKFPESNDRNNTLTFLKVKLIYKRVRYAPNDDIKQKELLRLQAELTQKKAQTINERVELLFAMCIFMNDCLQGELLVSYLQQLENMLADVPGEKDYLYSLYYNTAASLFSDLDRPVEAIAADRKLLDVMEGMEKNHVSKGRKFRNLARNYYIIYRRMLGNYKALSTPEVQSLYAKAKNLTHYSKAVRADYESNRRIDIYRAMEMQDYATARPLLKKELAKKDLTEHTRYNYLKMAREVARALGDRDFENMVSREYTDLLEERLRNHGNVRFRELQLIYDMNSLEVSRQNLQSENAKSIRKSQELALENMEAKAAAHRLMLIVVGVAALILIGLALYLYKIYRSYKAMAIRLSGVNSELVTERDNLRKTRDDLLAATKKAQLADQQKTEVVHNISHEIAEPVKAIVEFSQVIVDSIDDRKRQYYDRFAKTIDLNARLLTTLVNDILEVANLDRGLMSLQINNVDLRNLAQIAVDTTSLNIPEDKKDIEIKMKLPPADVLCSANTDAERVDQVLMNLLSNAVKFTEQGSITLKLTVDPVADNAIFEVIDTGIGVPREKMKTIFGRFEKVDRYSQGSGLGLHISRVIARLLGGDVEIDPNHRKGSRFIFTLPLSPKEKGKK